VGFDAFALNRRFEVLSKNLLATVGLSRKGGKMHFPVEDESSPPNP